MAWFGKLLRHVERANPFKDVMVQMVLGGVLVAWLWTIDWSTLGHPPLGDRHVHRPTADGKGYVCGVRRPAGDWHYVIHRDDPDELDRLLREAARRNEWEADATAEAPAGR